MGRQVFRMVDADTRSSTRRQQEERVRSAQQRAFQDVLTSRDAVERRAAIRQAIDAFLNACEASEAHPA
jgi:hypothetical protein